ncbi:MAG: NTP/NDP exchange transporter [Acidobacteriota bacterium]
MSNPLRTVFDFKRQEIPVAISLFFFFFLVIAVFQILKPLKKGLFVNSYGDYGAEMELYAKLANIGMALLAMIFFTYLYNRMPRQQIIYVLCVFFIAWFVWFAFALVDPGWFSIWSFYLIGDVETTLFVAAFWAYATDLSNSDQAKRLFGVIGGGGVIGGWVGISFASTLLESIGMRGLLIMTTAMMVLIGVLTFGIERWIRQTGVFHGPTHLREVRKRASQEKSKFREAIEGARLVAASKYLAAIVGIMAFYEIASQVIDYQFSTLLEPFETDVGTQSYIAKVYFYANTLAVLVQFFLVSLIMRKLGLTTALLVLPVAILATSPVFLAVPTLTVVSFFVFFENGLNYSIQQTSRESLFVPTSPDEKYKARAFTDMFVQRAAKGVGIGAVIALGLLGFSARQFTWITITVVILMALCGIYAGRRFASTIRDKGDKLKAA